MSELYPTQAEMQEWLNELWTADPAAYEYLKYYEDDETAALLDALEERLYLMGGLDERASHEKIDG